MEGLRKQTCNKRLATAGSYLHLQAGGTVGEDGIDRGQGDLEEAGTMKNQFNGENAAAAGNISPCNSVEVKQHPGFSLPPTSNLPAVPCQAVKLGEDDLGY